MIAVPSVVGMMLGAKIGARLLNVLKGTVIRRMVIAVLLFAGLRALLKGTGCGHEAGRARRTERRPRAWCSRRDSCATRAGWSGARASGWLR